jgi:hypothetical protein
MFRPHVIQFTGEFGSTEYRLGTALSEPVHPEDEILLRDLELLASSFDPCACGEKTTTGLNPVSAPISPFMAAITPSPVAARTVTKGTATNRQPSKNLKTRVSNH